jgi:hypothetical protein
MSAAAVQVPLILTDFSCTAFDPADIAATAAILAKSCDRRRDGRTR